LPSVVDEIAVSPAAPLARSVARLGTESAFSVLARAKEIERLGRSIVHLEIGEPDFPTPEHVADAAVEAIRSGETHYTPAAGVTEFREVIAAELSRGRAIAVTPDRVLVANGAKPFLFFVILAVCDRGDEIIYPDPGFPIYESVIRWSGGVPVPLPLRKELGFSFSLEDLSARLSPRTKLVIFNSPNNPTGGVVPAGDLRAAAELILDTSAWVLSDEVYQRIVYDTEAASIAGMPGMLERCVLLDGLSKTYAMTGWRCGYAAVPKPLVEPLTRLIVNSVSCVPAFVQAAGIAALTGPQSSVAEMVAEFRARRDLIASGLNELPGVSCRTPQGAFYAFPDVSDVPIAPRDLADRLLEQAGVALLAGSDFGARGADHLRISYANSRDQLELALDRMEQFLTNPGQAGPRARRGARPDAPT
jgi:aspartate aminotransferase